MILWKLLITLLVFSAIIPLLGIPYDWKVISLTSLAVSEFILSLVLVIRYKALVNAVERYTETGISAALVEEEAYVYQEEEALHSERSGE